MNKQSLVCSVKKSIWYVFNWSEYTAKHVDEYLGLAWNAAALKSHWVKLLKQKKQKQRKPPCIYQFMET